MPKIEKKLVFHFFKSLIEDFFWEFRLVPQKSIPKSTYLVSTLQEFVLDLHKVAFALLRLERLVDDGKARVVLHLIVATVAMA